MVDVGPTVPLDTFPAFDEDASDEVDVGRWGRLVPLASNFYKASEVDLYKPEHSFGRGSACDTIFKELGISGLHCRIYKELITSAKSTTTIVKIEDTRYARFSALYHHRIPLESLMVVLGSNFTPY